MQVRWRDLDGLGHVNHTVVLTYLEEGRDALLERHGIRRDEYVVGRCSVNFRREIDPAFKAVTVAVRGARAGPLERHHQRAHPRRRAASVVVEAEFGLVLWDPEQRGSRPITDRSARRSRKPGRQHG